VAGEPRQQQVLGRAADLRPEATTDVGGDHPHLLGCEPVGPDERVADAVGPLGRAEDVEAAVGRPRRRRRPALERHPGEPLVHDALGHDDVAAVEQRVVATEVERDGHVRAGVGVEHDLVGGCLLRFDHGGQRIDVDPHGLGGVDALGRLLAQHHGDGFADEPDAPGGEEGAQHRLVEHGDGRSQRGEVDVGPGHDRGHPRHAERVVDVDAEQHTVGDGRPHEGRVQRAVEQRIAEVGAVGAANGQEPGVLDPRDPVAEDARPTGADGAAHEGGSLRLARGSYGNGTSPVLVTARKARKGQASGTGMRGGGAGRRA
jgi:hypothetical protein